VGAEHLALLGFLVLVPVAILGPLTERVDGGRRPFKPGILAFALGAVAFGVSKLVIERGAARYGIEPPREGKADLVSVAFAFLVAGPIDESLRVLAAIPSLRSKGLRQPYDAMRVAVGSALGFAALSTFDRLHEAPLTALSVTRGILDITVHATLSASWGYALGRERRRRIGGIGFTRGFLTAVVFGTIATHLLFARGQTAIFAVAPLIATSTVFALVARRDLLRMNESRKRSRLSRLLPVAAPSIEELERVLLTRPERPMTLRWIVFGALVTVGVLTSMLAGSVFLGHETGVDFAAVDRADAFEQSVPPLVLLGTAAFAAFPISGFLVARASSARGVLEPALGASIAIVGLVVLLGVAAPIAVVFGVALAPVAFALACAGAWAGLER
jgi:RsiW-degrading membrane proteinase PrsW (M82 family)